MADNAEGGVQAIDLVRAAEARLPPLKREGSIARYEDRLRRHKSTINGLIEDYHLNQQTYATQEATIRLPLLQRVENLRQKKDIVDIKIGMRRIQGQVMAFRRRMNTSKASVPEIECQIQLIQADKEAVSPRPAQPRSCDLPGQVPSSHGTVAGAFDTGSLSHALDNNPVSVSLGIGFNSLAPITDLEAFALAPALNYASASDLNLSN